MKTIRSKTAVRTMMKSVAPERREIDLIIFLQDWEDAYNVGGMFRVGDACGAKELILTGRTPQPPNPMIGVTSLGAHRRLPYRYIQRYDDAMKTLKAEGYTMVAVEIAEGAQNFREFAFPDKTCLVLGNEGAGIYSSVIKACDAAVFIPMAGKGRSLNVHVAAAVVAFEATLRMPTPESE